MPFLYKELGEKRETFITWPDPQTLKGLMMTGNDWDA